MHKPSELYSLNGHGSGPNTDWLVFTIKLVGKNTKENQHQISNSQKLAKLCTTTFNLLLVCRFAVIS
jgi:hypothetical protein